MSLNRYQEHKGILDAVLDGVPKAGAGPKRVIEWICRGRREYSGLLDRARATRRLRRRYRECKHTRWSNLNEVAHTPHALYRCDLCGAREWVKIGEWPTGRPRKTF